jgi:hypothetical protein
MIMPSQSGSLVILGRKLASIAGETMQDTAKLKNVIQLSERGVLSELATASLMSVVGGKASHAISDFSSIAALAETK